MSSGLRSWCSADVGGGVGAGELRAKRGPQETTAPAKTSAPVSKALVLIGSSLFGALYRAGTACAFITPQLKCRHACRFQPSQPLANDPRRVAGRTADRAAGSLRGEG